MEQARRLENDDQADQGAQNAWLANYSVKFQGCHSQVIFNDNADGNGDAMMIEQGLARFRLCASDSCNANDAYGCSSGAEYLVDMGTFADAWTEAQMNAQEYECEKARENCGCDADDVDDADTCEYQCMTNLGMSYCIDEEDEQEQFEVQRYLECAQMEINNDDDANANVELFIGPYCSSDGSAILLGVFTDDTCSVRTSTSTYATYNGGVTLPYSSKSIVNLNCMSCKEPSDDAEQDEYNYNNNADAQDADEVTEMCENLYYAAGKCEQNLAYSSNSDACNFIAGIQISRKTGSVSYSRAPSKSAGAFIGIFAVSTVLLGAYAYYLQTKVSRAQVALH